MRTWIMAIRPKTLPASIAPVAMGASLVIKENSIDSKILFYTFLCTLLVQICTNLTNDLFDYLSGRDTKDRVGPIRVTQSGLVDPKTMKIAVVICYILAILAGIPLIIHAGITAACILAVSLLCAYAYSSGPFPISTLGLSEFFLLIFFGPLSVAGTAFLQTGTWEFSHAIYGLAPAFLSIALITLNNLRDYEQDKLVGKKTLVVRFGKTFGKVEYILSVLMPLVSITYASLQKPIMAILASYLIIAFILIKQVLQAKEPKNLIPPFEKTGALTLLFSFAFVVLWML